MHRFVSPEGHRSSRFAPTLALLTVFVLMGCEGQPATDGDLSVWPETTGGVPLDPDVEARIDRLLGSMTVEEKVGQTIQADINSIEPADILTYRLGSVLNGGNSAPGANNYAPAREWLELADAYYDAAMDTSDGRKAIPILWGTDAVHGHNNVVGATIFPHNIGLGAARNPELMARIGEVTAVEARVTGQDWTFAPTVAVVRDDRWGRTYEGYSEDPEVVASYAGEVVRGIQGDKDTPGFLRGGHLLANAKHFLGDGGTVNGKDQGDNVSSEADLARIHAAGYGPAIDAGVQVVMASFNSWRGAKLHGHRYLLTDVLKGRMGFNGFVVGDWNGHGQLPGCEATDCPESLIAGVDMYMAPDSWRGLYDNTVAQAKAGEIPAARLDDAVRRILRVKIRAGLFEQPRPSEREFGGMFAMLGSAPHREVAEQAVRESLVLLKNADQILPLDPSSRVLVAGDGAHNIGKQSGGWTLNWQGTGHERVHFPNGSSIWEGIRAAVLAGSGRAVLSVDGTYRQRPDVAIVVFGEDPYAEFVGDRERLDYSAERPGDLALLRKLRGEGIPVVAVFLSGRPLWVNPEINASDAFVAASLPGTQGGAVAGVLFRAADGSAGHDFKGKLSFSWPATDDPTPINRGDAVYEPLFPFGFGLTYSDDGEVPTLSEERGERHSAASKGVYFSGGVLSPGLSWESVIGAAKTPLSVPGDASAPVSVSAVDRTAQEDSRRLAWTGAADATIRVSGPTTDYAREATGDMTLAIDYRLDGAPTAPMYLVVACGDGCAGEADISGALESASPGEWQRLDVRLSCFAESGADLAAITSPFGLRTAGALTLTVSDIRLATNEGQAEGCPGP